MEEDFGYIEENKMSLDPTKKLLLVTYYWPPAGGPGVQRWLKLCKYLPNLGYDITVCIPENPSYPILDESLLKDIHPSLRILKFKIWEPYALARKLTPKNEKLKAGQFGERDNWRARLSIWIRGNLFIPDARKFWIKPMQKHLKELISKERYDVLITTGPPHSLHLIGLGLHNFLIKKKIRWVADFRDPWTGISYHSKLKLMSWAAARHIDLERKVLQKADLILTTSYTDTEIFKKESKGKVETLTNGFDPEDIPVEEIEKKNIIAYIGALEQLRNPSVLWTALESVMDIPDWEFHFIGKVDPQIQEDLKERPAGSRIKFFGYMPHSEAVKAMFSSKILVLTNFNKQDSRGIIPGKVFEYLASKGYILSIGPADSDVEKILMKTKAGQHFTYSQTQEIQNFIRQSLSSNELPDGNISDFSRPKLAQRLDAILRKLN